MKRALFPILPALLLACSAAPIEKPSPLGHGGAGGATASNGGGAGGAPVDAGSPSQCCPADSDAGAGKCCDGVHDGFMVCGGGAAVLCGVAP